MNIRRVVTGHDHTGKAVFVSDEAVEPVIMAIAPGVLNWDLWGADQAPTFPDAGQAPAVRGQWPPVHGYRFTLFSLPPGYMVAPAGHAGAELGEEDMTAALKEAEDKAPGLVGSFDEEPGMHTSDTVDLLFVVSGEVVCELGDGGEALIKAGDVFIQNGTRHRWRNEGPEPVVMVGCLVGAHRARTGTDA